MCERTVVTAATMDTGEPRTVLILAFYSLCLLGAGSTQKPEVCSLERKSIEIDSVNTQIVCSGVKPEETVVWIIQPRGGQALAVGHCPPVPSNCTVSVPSKFTVTRTSADKSHMTIVGPVTRDDGAQQIKCDARTVDGGSRTVYDKHLDVFKRGQTTCSWTVPEDGSKWYMAGQCDFTNTFSSMGCYFCTWFERRGRTAWKMIPDNLTSLSVNRSDGDDLVNYTCRFRKEIPEVGGEYTHRVNCEHSQQNILRRRPVFIRPPSTPTHNCPVYVAEGKTFRCECSVTDAGQPARALTWTQAPDSRSDDKKAKQIRRSTIELTRSNVQRSDNGQEYTCTAQQGPSASYTLRVAYGPDVVYAAVTSWRRVACIPVNVNPAPSFEWRRRDSRSVLGREQMLEIEVEDLEEDWVLVCTATNAENGGRSVEGSISMDALRNGNFTLAVSDRNVVAADDRLAAGVGIGAVVVLVPVVAVVIVLLLMLRKRNWILPCAASQGLPQLPNERESIHPLVNMEERVTAPENEGAREEGVTGLRSAPSASERGTPEGASNYDMLDRTQPPTVSPYESLRPQGAGPSLSAHPDSPTEGEDTGPVYANREMFEAPVYVNSYPGERRMT